MKIQKETLREQGITLIALVITIIILLILAGVTLGTALGENGLFQRAKGAVNAYRKAEEEESQGINDIIEVMGKNAETLTVEDYGRYVDYGLDINNNNNTKDDWRIFYVGNGKDGQKSIFLIAADYVSSECPAILEATDEAHAHMTKNTNEGYENCYYWANDTAAVYHCNDGHNETLNNNKPQCSFPEIFMPTTDYCSENKHYYCSDYVDNGSGGNVNSRCASALQCTENWEPFIEKSTNGSYADYAIGGPTIEMWVASWNEKHGKNSKDDKKVELYANSETDGTGYFVGVDVTSKTNSYNLSTTTGYNDTLYFPHRSNVGLNLDNTGEADDKCDGYWLASPGATSTIDVSGIHFTGGVTSFHNVNPDRAVRPIIQLRHSVTLTRGEDKVYTIS